jgi:AcrR family transcriptional regulator
MPCAKTVNARHRESAPFVPISTQVVSQASRARHRINLQQLSNSLNIVDSRMKSGHSSDETGRTRDAILDATESLMREEGYAAVSSRRVAERAGLKSQLVHYHFGTMDDLFLALFQRAGAQYFERHVQAMTSVDPLRALWKLIIDRTGMELIFEFMALSNHRKVIRKEIALANERTRTMQSALLTRALQLRGIAPEVCPPNVLSVVMSGIALAVVSEETIGSTIAHAETLAFIEQLLDKTVTPAPAAKRVSRVRKEKIRA